MAHVRENDLTEGFSGKFGPKFVFKQLRGKTIVARRAKPSTKESTLQRDNRERFRKATQYAKAMMLIAERKAYYWKKAKKMKLPNAYTAAIADYMRKPKIEELSATTTNAALSVKIRAVKKDFGLKMMKVMALDDAGQQIEQQDTIKDFSCWHYRFKIPKDRIAKVIVVVQDEAGNVLSRELIV